MCYKLTRAPEPIAIILSRIFDLLINRLGYQQIIPSLILLPCLLLAWFKPNFAQGIFGSVENFGTRLADRKRLAIVSIAAAAILIRVALLWILPIPVPKVHDEFSYLLAGDTFAHGRLTNPTHPLWQFFDTIHVNQLPTYMSKYPPAQGGVLAVGELLGHPWFGVVLSVAAMCAAVLWMLQGWLPPRWALLGAVLVLMRVGIFSYWMNSYWGGAVPAIGGALVVGAMPRILRNPRARDALLLSLGAALLANSRPLEGIIYFLPVLVVLLFWLVGRKSPQLRVTLPRMVLPFCALMLFCGAFLGYYNWRGTGSPAVFPYAVNERTYVTTPTFFWDKPRPPMHYANPQFESFYNGWVRQSWMESRIDSFAKASKQLFSNLSKIVYFYMWPELCVLFIAMLWVARDRRTRFLLLLCAICFFAFLLVPWFQAHYAAPMLAAMFALLTQALRHLRRWRTAQRPVGIGLSRVVVLAALCFAPFHPHSEPFGHPAPEGIEYRALFESRLKQTPGDHLVIVHYSNRPGADPAKSAGIIPEWVYNSADIDRSKIVWARDIPGTDIRPVLEYFRTRQVWIAEPDANPPRLTPLAN